MDRLEKLPDGSYAATVDPFVWKPALSPVLTNVPNVSKGGKLKKSRKRKRTRRGIQ